MYNKIRRNFRELKQYKNQIVPNKKRLDQDKSLPLNDLLRELLDMDIDLNSSLSNDE